MRIVRRVAGVNHLPSVHRHPAWWLLLLVGLLPACATFQPAPLEQVPFHARAVTQRQGAVQVSAVVLSAEESAAAFGVPLAEDGIQPVWLHIENGEDVVYLFMPAALDPTYFSPQEAAWKSRLTFGGGPREHPHVTLLRRAQDAHPHTPTRRWKALSTRSSTKG